MEDGDDMWDVLSQIPSNIMDTDANTSSSPKRKRSCTVDLGVENRKSPRIVKPPSRTNYR